MYNFQKSILKEGIKTSLPFNIKALLQHIHFVLIFKWLCTVEGKTI